MSEEKGVSLKVPEIYGLLCPKCKRKLFKLVKERITDKVVREAVGI